NGYSDPKKSSQQQGEDGAIESAPDCRQHAELALIDVPCCRSEKTQTILLHGRHGLPPHLPEDVYHQENGKPGKRYRESAKRPVKEYVERGRRPGYGSTGRL